MHVIDLELLADPVSGQPTPEQQGTDRTHDHHGAPRRHPQPEPQHPEHQTVDEHDGHEGPENRVVEITAQRMPLRTLDHVGNEQDHPDHGGDHGEHDDDGPHCADHGVHGLPHGGQTGDPERDGERVRRHPAAPLAHASTVAAHRLRSRGGSWRIVADMWDAGLA